MTTWSDESMPTTGWGTEFLLINSTDKLLISAGTSQYVLLQEGPSTPL